MERGDLTDRNLNLRIQSCRTKQGLARRIRKMIICRANIDAVVDIGYQIKSCINNALEGIEIFDLSSDVHVWASHENCTI